MEAKELSEFTDQELLDEAKKKTLSPTINALFIGIMIGIVIYSIVVDSLGLCTLIPLFLIYKLVQGSKKDQALEAILKERKLK